MLSFPTCAAARAAQTHGSPIVGSDLSRSVARRSTVVQSPFRYASSADASGFGGNRAINPTTLAMPAARAASVKTAHPLGAPADATRSCAFPQDLGRPPRFAGLRGLILRTDSSPVKRAELACNDFRMNSPSVW